MQKSVLFYYYVFSLLVGTGVYIAQKLQTPLPNLINFYLNDFLIIPIILTTSLYVLRWSRRNKNYTISLWLVLYMATFYSIVFEYYLPKFHPRYTADSIDVILYFVSGLLFYYLQKRDL